MTQLWLIAGVVLGAIEMLTVTFWSLPFALGALCTALIAWLDLPVTVQLGFFAVSSLIMLFVIQKWLKTSLARSGKEELLTNAQAMIGREAIVVEAIESQVKPGAVKLGGELWTANAMNGETIPVGTTVVIREVGGAVVRVAAKD